MRLRSGVLVAVAVLAGCTAPPAQPAPTAARPAAPAAPTSGPSGTATGPSMNIARAAHTATLLPDGRALIAGGCAIDGCEGFRIAAQSEFYVPSQRRFVTGPVMTAPRAGHTATGLRDGRVLLTGGYGSEGVPPWSAAELFDPRTGAFRRTGDMAVRRGAHTATLLRDGRVLIVGGTDGGRALTTVEAYDPASGSFRVMAPLPGPRATHGAALLADGRVLVVGGQSGVGHGSQLLDTAAAYDPATDKWQEVGRLATPKYKLAVAALADGRAVVLGGQTADDPRARLATTEVFDPHAGRFTPGPTMAEPRYKISDAVVRLADGRIAVGGGYGVDVFDGRRFAAAGAGGYERQFPAVVALGDGTVLVTGGYDQRTRVTATAFIARP